MNQNEKIEINATDIGIMPDMPKTEEFFNKHFIRIDERSRIVYAFSDAFLQPCETDILVNEKGGRHFRLIINGELSEENPAGLISDERGVPLLKWDAKNKKIVRRTEKEIQADIEAMMPPLETHQRDAILQTHQALADVLQVPIEHRGKYYSVTMEKQNLLSAQLGLFGLNQQAGIPFELSWNATGEVCELWEFSDLLELANIMAAYVEPLAQMQREAEVKIKVSKNEQEVKSHVEKLRNDLQSVIDNIDK